MRVLHLFNWRLKDVESELEKISEQGFDAIQINPIQPLKEDGLRQWWMSYQPTAFSIGNFFGSKEDLRKLCFEAERYGIKIIADVVCNHMAQENNGGLHPHEKVDPKIRNRSDFWRETKNIENWNDRYQVTHYCMGLPGLNLNNHDLQDIIIDFLNDLIDCGVAGFRFDAAKHIALPEEGCDFWPRVIYCLKKYGIIVYGEVLFTEKDLVEKYSPYIGVLTNNGGPNGNRVIFFEESHDSYYDFGYTKDVDSMEIARRYRNLANNYDNTMFYARPFDETWKSDIVKQGNKAGIKHYAYI